MGCCCGPHDAAPSARHEQARRLFGFLCAAGRRQTTTPATPAREQANELGIPPNRPMVMHTKNPKEFGSCAPAPYQTVCAHGWRPGLLRTTWSVLSFLLFAPADSSGGGVRGAGPAVLKKRPGSIESGRPPRYVLTFGAPRWHPRLALTPSHAHTIEYTGRDPTPGRGRFEGRAIISCCLRISRQQGALIDRIRCRAGAASACDGRGGAGGRTDGPTRRLWTLSHASCDSGRARRPRWACRPWRMRQARQQTRRASRRFDACAASRS